MYIVKVGALYVGQDGAMTERQSRAARFDDDPKPRVVKLKTIADCTADSMRGLADDVIGSDPDPINPMPSDDGEK